MLVMDSNLYHVKGFLLQMKNSRSLY